MEPKMADVTMHIDEQTSPDERESLRDKLLQLGGVMAADYQDNHPHLMVIEYNPDQLAAKQLVETAQKNGYHAELIGL